MVILLDAKQNFMLPSTQRYEFRWSGPDYLQWCTGKRGSSCGHLIVSPGFFLDWKPSAAVVLLGAGSDLLFLHPLPPLD